MRSSILYGSHIYRRHIRKELAAFIEDIGKGDYGKDLGVSMDKLCVAYWASRK